MECQPQSPNIGTSSQSEKCNRNMEKLTGKFPVDCQPQNPNIGTSSHSEKYKRNIEKLKNAVVEVLSLHSAKSLTEDSKKRIEKRLTELFPVIRTPDHPPYAAMILNAITTLNKKGGSSEKSISEFIKSNYDVPWAHSSYLSHHLSKLSQEGDIVVTSDNCYVIPTLSPNPKHKEKQQECHEDKGQDSGEEGNLEIKKLCHLQNQENYADAIDEAKELCDEMNDVKYQSQGQQIEVTSKGLQSSFNGDNGALMLIPRPCSPRLEYEQEESIKEQGKRSSDFLSPFGVEKQQPQCQHQSRSPISKAEKDRDIPSLPLSDDLPYEYQQHTLPQHQGRVRGKRPKSEPKIVKRDEALFALQHERLQNREQGRSCKPKRDGKTTGDILPSHDLKQGRPQKSNSDETTLGDFLASQNLGRGRHSKRK